MPAASEPPAHVSRRSVTLDLSHVTPRACVPLPTLAPPCRPACTAVTCCRPCGYISEMQVHRQPTADIYGIGLVAVPASS